MEQHIRESNLIEGIDSATEDAQSMTAWLWLLEQPKISHRVICKLQKRITINQTDLSPNMRGYYRDMSKINVQVGSFTPIAYPFVMGAMNVWISELKKNTPLANHIAFEKIHPFVDGNGRTGRMLLWYEELHVGKLPTLYTASKRAEYYSLLVK